MERIAHLQDVREVQTSGGNRRYVVTDDDGREYTTFRPRIGDRAKELEGRRARIEFHEEQRGRFLNVYLDAVEPLEEDADELEPGDEVEEVAWKTAIDAAPWLVGQGEPQEPLPADELFERLKPFKELVSEDIRVGTADDDADVDGGG